MSTAPLEIEIDNQNSGDINTNMQYLHIRVGRKQVVQYFTRTLNFPQNQMYKVRHSINPKATLICKHWNFPKVKSVWLVSYQNLKYCKVSEMHQENLIINSPFQTWAEVLSSVGLKAEINKNHGCINCPQPKGSYTEYISYQLTNRYMVRCLSVSVYAPIEFVLSYIYMSKVFQRVFHTRASSIPINWSHSSLKRQTFIILFILMVMHSHVCIQCEFLAFSGCVCNFYLSYIFANFVLENVWTISHSI